MTVFQNINKSTFVQLGKCLTLVINYKTNYIIMQTKLISKEFVRQYAPKENLVTSEPVRSIQKLVNRHNKPTRDSSSHMGNILTQIISKAPYPDFRYFCPFCGTLDVFIQIDEEMQMIRVCCLDCKKVWLEEKFVRSEVKKQCLC